MKRSVILTDRLGPDILLVLTMKRQVLHRERAHLKVPGCSLVLSALLTKKLPTFLSRLNEISVRWPIYIIKSVDKTKFLYTTSPPTQHHSFFRNYPFIHLLFNRCDH